MFRRVFAFFNKDCVHRKKNNPATKKAQINKACRGKGGVKHTLFFYII